MTPRLSNWLRIWLTTVAHRIIQRSRTRHKDCIFSCFGLNCNKAVRFLFPACKLLKRMVGAAGVEPDIGVENTQLTDSENASNSSNATIAKSSVQITYKDFPELQNFQASPALAQHAEVLFNIYTSIGCR